MAVNVTDAPLHIVEPTLELIEIVGEFVELTVIPILFEKAVLLAAHKLVFVKIHDTVSPLAKVLLI